MIPELTDNVLPEGLHVCTLEEVETAFGRFWKTDRRIKLTTQLWRFVGEARKSGDVVALIIDGSYVTGKAAPGDIDLVVVFRQGTEVASAPGPFAQFLRDRKAVKREFGIDAFACVDGGDKLAWWLSFFARIQTDDPEKASGQARKGLLRIELC